MTSTGRAISTPSAPICSRTPDRAASGSIAADRSTASTIAMYRASTATTTPLSIVTLVRAPSTASPPERCSNTTRELLPLIISSSLAGSRTPHAGA
jgi:hypothetical protein